MRKEKKRGREEDSYSDAACDEKPDLNVAIINQDYESWSYYLKYFVSEIGKSVSKSIFKIYSR